MPVDNFDKIKPLLEFDKKRETFYFVQVILRKKDVANRKVNGTNNNSRLIKAYYVSNEEYYDWVKPEIIQLCEVFKARAGINLNRREFKRTAFHTLRKLTDLIMNGEYDKVKKVYNTTCGVYSQETDKRWLLDIDDPKNLKKINKLAEDIETLQPEGPKAKAIIPSKSGAHLITSPFNVKQFKELTEWSSVEIHKNNPVNLYIPDM